MKAKIDWALLLIISLALLASLWHLATVPPVWWDEGWNLTVARNWVELGHYGRLLDGKPISPGMSNGFTTVAPVALSFRLLGVGIWQGRLPGVLFVLASLVLLYHLARRLYGREVALATLMVVLFMSNSLPSSPPPPYLTVQPTLIGRQVLGENPSLCFLLAGYASLLAAFSRPFWFMPLTLLFWGLALISKQQVIPFWFLSLLVPLALAAWRRAWPTCQLLAVAICGSALASQFLNWGLHLLLRDQSLPVTPVHGLYAITALVTAWRPRLIALHSILQFGFPTLVGLIYGAGKLWRETRAPAFLSPETTLRLSFLALTISWFMWFTLLSAGWTRYLYPSVLLGSVLVAVALQDLTQNFNFSKTLADIAESWRSRSLQRPALMAFLALFLVFMSVPQALMNYVGYHKVNSSPAALQVARFLNTQTPPEALIETYDTELFFLLDRRYHYPPDQIHVEVIRRGWLGQAAPIPYDALAADPDYLVVGPFIRNWHLYDGILASNSFSLLAKIGDYQIYQRHRADSPG